MARWSVAPCVRRAKVGELQRRHVVWCASAKLIAPLHPFRGMFCNGVQVLPLTVVPLARLRTGSVFAQDGNIASSSSEGELQ
jgi:hypothetical protein